MAADVVTHGQRTCSVEFIDEFDESDNADEISRHAVDAGADLALRIRAACPHGCDLTGQMVSIRDVGDTELASADLMELEDGAHATQELVLRAPLKEGEHVYWAVLAAREQEGVLHEETSTPFYLLVNAHTAHVNTWGWPSAIAAGERFTFKVSIKCSSGCRLGGTPFRVLDENGEQIAAGSLRDEVWPGTGAVYFAEVEAEASSTIGNHQWTVETPGSHAEVPHAAGSSAFALKVVDRPDCEVTIEAFDGEKHTPIKGMHILMHPYRAFTDEDGVARVRVARGRYELAVSGFRYIPYRGVINAEGDVTMRAELIMEPESDGYFRP